LLVFGKLTNSAVFLGDNFDTLLASQPGANSKG